MKKAKKILSLMLVVAMTLSMMVFTGGTASAVTLEDFPDVDSIVYKEAVDLLSAIGVLKGDERGFRPKDSITREEAAKIVTYMLLGTTAADRLSHRPSSFTDVATESWSNPYIEYCVEMGIIKGYGDGRFGPSDPVTGSQMAKMLLMVIGYGGKGEFNNPASWELNAIVEGQRRGILGSVDVDYTKPATREQVAQYTFMSMWHPDAYLVTYNTLINDYIDRNNSIFTPSSVQSYLYNEVFNLNIQGLEDDFGYAVRRWRNANNIVITGEYKTEIILGEAVTSSTLTKAALFSEYSWDEDVLVFINGYTDNVRRDDSSFAVRGDSRSYPGIDGVDAPYGMHLTFIDTAPYDGKVDKIVGTYEYLAKVTTVNPYTGAYKVAVFEEFANQAGRIIATDIIDGGFKVDDYVLITPTNEGYLRVNEFAQPLQVVAAEEKTGQITSFSGNAAAAKNIFNNPTVTFGGVTYNLSAMAYKTATLSSGSFGKDTIFWFDSHGLIIGFDAVGASAGSLNYLYVNSTQAMESSAWSTGSARLSVTYPNGKTETLSLRTNAKNDTAYGINGATIDLTAATSFAPVPGVPTGWYSYTMNSNGTVNINSLQAETDVLSGGDTLTVDTNSTIVDVDGSSMRATSNTVLSVLAGGTLRTFTGFQNFPAKTYDTNDDIEILVIYAVDAKKDVTSVITHIYVIGTTALAPLSYGVVTYAGDETPDGRVYMVQTKDAEPITVVQTGLPATVSFGSHVLVEYDGTEVSIFPITADVAGEYRFIWGVVEGVDNSYIHVQPIDEPNMFTDYVGGELAIATKDGSAESFIYADDCIVYDGTSFIVGGNPRVGDVVTFVVDYVSESVTVLTIKGVTASSFAYN